LRDRFETETTSALSGARVNAAGAERLPNVSSLAFEGVDLQTLLVRLDLAGVAASAGSACAAGSSEPSHVIAALGAPGWVRAGTVRFSLGRLTGERDVTELAQRLRVIVADLREEPAFLGTS